MSAFEELKSRLAKERHTWLVTGVAGFIGCNLLQALLKLEQRVIGLDNFATGLSGNLKQIRAKVTPEQWSLFHFIDGDIRNIETCHNACRDAEFVLHEAALGSVPRSIKDPIATNGTNIDGFLNILVATRDAGVKRLVYAASSSTYGDHQSLPRVEDKIGKPLSPYAITKLVNELYADVFAKTYGFASIGLRYFNVFGPRQDPSSAYAAVMPAWIAAMIKNKPVWINGDGESSRDFCYIQNVVQANLLAATTTDESATNQVYNIAVGEQITLNGLFESLRLELEPNFPHLRHFKPSFRDFRVGDVRHSLADISKARALLGYEPSHNLRQGLSEAMAWYAINVS